MTTVSSTSAQTAQLDQVRAQQDQVRAQLRHQNAAVDSLLGQVSQLRQREDAVPPSSPTRRRSWPRRGPTSRTRARPWLRRGADYEGAIDELESLLVSIYRNGEPDIASVLLESDGVDDLAGQGPPTSRASKAAESRAASTGSATSARPPALTSPRSKTSIDQMQAARAAIAERQQTLAASRALLEERESALARRAGTPPHAARGPPGQGTEPR